jgi:hypothetical protein
MNKSNMIRQYYRLALSCLLLMTVSWVMAQNGSHWQCDIYGYRYDMTVCLTLDYNGAVAPDLSDYEVAAFVGEECRGVASVQTVKTSNSTSVQYGYLRVRSNLSEGETVSFKAYHFQTGQVMEMSQTLAFKAQSLTGMPSTPYKLTLPGLLRGDANGDGKINEADVEAVVDKILGMEPGNFKENAANVNGDNAIDVADVVGIMHIIIGKEDI